MIGQGRPKWSTWYSSVQGTKRTKKYGFHTKEHAIYWSVYLKFRFLFPRGTYSLAHFFCSLNIYKTSIYTSIKLAIIFIMENWSHPSLWMLQFGCLKALHRICTPSSCMLLFPRSRLCRFGLFKIAEARSRQHALVRTQPINL